MPSRLMIGDCMAANLGLASPGATLISGVISTNDTRSVRRASGLVQTPYPFLWLAACRLLSVGGFPTSGPMTPLRSE